MTVYPGSKKGYGEHNSPCTPLCKGGEHQGATYCGARGSDIVKFELYNLDYRLWAK